MDEVVTSLCSQDAEVLERILGSNSKRHGGHIEFISRTPQYHLQKVIRHAVTAIAQLDQHEGLTSNENALDHIERTLVRSCMALHVCLKLNNKKILNDTN